MLLGVLALVLAGCGGGEAEGPVASQASSVPAVAGMPASPSAGPARSQCEDAVAVAAEVGGTGDQPDDLWPAFDACGSVDELASADQVHPEALDGADPATYVSTQCETEPAVEGSVLCESLG